MFVELPSGIATANIFSPEQTYDIGMLFGKISDMNVHGTGIAKLQLWHDLELLARKPN